MMTKTEIEEFLSGPELQKLYESKDREEQDYKTWYSELVNSLDFANQHMLVTPTEIGHDLFDIMYQERLNEYILRDL